MSASNPIRGELWINKNTDRTYKVLSVISGSSTVVVAELMPLGNEPIPDWQKYGVEVWSKWLANWKLKPEHDLEKGDVFYFHGRPDATLLYIADDKVIRFNRNSPGASWDTFGMYKSTFGPNSVVKVTNSYGFLLEDDK